MSEGCGADQVQRITAEPVTISGVFVYRSMRQMPDGRPATGPDARSLGVRPGVGRGSDIPVDDDGYVRPLTGGLSVAPGDPMNLPGHRRPAALGGMGKDPVWRLDLRTLDDRLIYRPDPARPEQHGFIEPAIMMRLDDLQTLIAGTWPDWKVV